MGRGNRSPILVLRSAYPGNIPGLIGWVDFAGINSKITVSGGKITTLTDGAGNVWAQSNATHQPTVNTAFLGGLNTATFGASVNLGTTFGSNTTSSTVMVLVRPTNSNQNNAIVASFGGTGSLSLETASNNVAAYGVYLNNMGGASDSTPGSCLTNTWTVLCYTYNDSIPLGTLTINNGLGYFASQTTTSASGQFWDTVMTLGNTGSNALPGDIAEMFFFNRPITASEQTQIFNYFVSKWSLSSIILPTPPTPGMVCDYDFSGMNSTLTVSGGNISQITDGSGNGYTLTAATNHQPTQHIAGAPSGLNSSTWFHNGSNTLQLISASLGITDIVNFTIFMVVNPTTIVAQDEICGSNSGRTSVIGIDAPQTGNANRLEAFWNDLGGESFMANNAYQTGWQIIVLNYQGSFNLSTAAAQWYLNNVANGTLSTQPYLFWSGFEGVILGGDTGSTRVLQGDIGEIILYSYAMTTGQMTTVYNALKTKWGL